jgi:hypothetical protein
MCPLGHFSLSFLPPSSLLVPRLYGRSLSMTVAKLFLLFFLINFYLCFGLWLVVPRLYGRSLLITVATFLFIADGMFVYFIPYL